MDERTCVECDGPMTGRHPSAKVCSKACRVARLVKSDAYKRARARHKQTDKYQQTAARYRRSGECAACGDSTRPESTHCRACWNRNCGPPAPAPRSGQRQRLALAKIAQAACGSTLSGILTNGPCACCGELFTAQSWRLDRPAIYCSQRCLRRAGKDRRRAVKREAFVSNVNRKAIYERDGYRCGLCGTRLAMTEVVPHPLAPTIDHVVPLAEGGKHEPANCQAAHFLCNSRKGDRAGLAEQLRLIA